MASMNLLFFAMMAASVAFALVFIVARHIRNFGIVDIAWAGGFAPVAGFYAASADGLVERRVLLAVMVGLWSLRLAVHLGRRVMSHHPAEDARYARLRHDWAGAVDLKMFLFFQAQAWLLAVLTVPFLIAARDAAPGWRGWEIGGLALWIVAFAGETIADWQLARFRRDPGNRGRVCDTGLWRFSRHPNYFFEWLVWAAFALFVAGAPWGWAGFLSPLLMWWFLVKVTGIRFTEEQSLRSKGEAYRAYQRRTSAFFPWFPRSTPDAKSVTYPSSP
jgi:steroid 5-alpha reductase family enzyme